MEEKTLEKKIEEIKNEIINYVKNTSVFLEHDQPIPIDVSLLEAGLIDSYGVVELLSFIETNWNIKISDEEVTKDNLGSINKMCHFIIKKQG